MIALTMFSFLISLHKRWGFEVGPEWADPGGCKSAEADAAWQPRRRTDAYLSNDIPLNEVLSRLEQQPPAEPSLFVEVEPTVSSERTDTDLATIPY